MDLCVHFGQPAFIVFISSLYLYFGFSNKHFSIQFNSMEDIISNCDAYVCFFS